MFTGIVDHCGTITKIDVQPGVRRFWIHHLFDNIVLGESISVDGICLTVTEILEGMFSCDISTETERVTTAKSLLLHQPVNLERAVQLSSRLGGHMMSGHIDQTCQLSQRVTQGEFIELYFVGIEAANKRYAMKKGSIAVNGVSLTINEVTEDGFTVMLIPHTLERTNLGLLQESESVNIEFDMIAKMLVEQIQKYSTLLQS